MTDPLWEALRRQHLEETHRASGSCPGWTCPTAQVLAALTQPAAPAEGLRERIAAFFRAYDSTHLVHDVAYEGVNDAVAALRAALAQPVAPAEGHVVRDVKLLEVSIVPTDAAPGEMDEHGAWGLIQPAAPAEGLDARGECPACTEQPHIGCEYAKEPTDD